MIDCDREEKKKKDDCGCNGRKIFPEVIAAFVRLQNCHGRSVLGTEGVESYSLGKLFLLRGGRYPLLMY